MVNRNAQGSLVQFAPVTYCIYEIRSGVPLRRRPPKAFRRPQQRAARRGAPTLAPASARDSMRSQMHCSKLVRPMAGSSPPGSMSNILADRTRFAKPSARQNQESCQHKRPSAGL